MRLNLETAVVGERVVLKPYRAAFVARYHAWMEDPWILGMKRRRQWLKSLFRRLQLARAVRRFPHLPALVMQR